MRKQPNRKLIGLFTLTGIGLFVGIMLLFIGDKLFLKDDDLSVMFFDESVKGLRVGSPVVFRGVEVGKVVKIDIVTNLDDLTFKIPVFIKIADQNFRYYGSGPHGEKQQIVRKLVDKGLRGRLTSQNFLTGQLMVELEMTPDVPAVYRSYSNKYIEIPTTLSPLGELSKGIENVPFREVFENLNSLLKTTNEYAPEIMGNTAAIIENLNNVVESVGGALDKSKGESTVTIDNFNRTLRDIGEAAQALRSFADYIDRHPESLIRGKGGY